MAKDVSIGEQLLSLIEGASEEDLTVLDESIESKERELLAMKSIRRTIALAIGIEKAPEPTKKPGPKPKVQTEDGELSNPEAKRMTIARYILKNGPLKSGKITELFNVGYGSISGMLKHAWFQSTENGYDLTPHGREMIKNAAAKNP